MSLPLEITLIWLSFLWFIGWMITVGWVSNSQPHMLRDLGFWLTLLWLVIAAFVWPFTLGAFIARK